MAQVELAAAAVEDLDRLIRTLSLASDARQRVRASLTPPGHPAGCVREPLGWVDAECGEEVGDSRGRTVLVNPGGPRPRGSSVTVAGGPWPRAASFVPWSNA